MTITKLAIITNEDTEIVRQVLQVRGLRATVKHGSGSTRCTMTVTPRNREDAQAIVDAVVGAGYIHAATDNWGKTQIRFEKAA